LQGAIKGYIFPCGGWDSAGPKNEGSRKMLILFLTALDLVATAVAVAIYTEAALAVRRLPTTNNKRSR